ncbi:hypothetical protein BRY73_24525 [Ochrobactrum sp. P6BS-III]|uniref:IclR family transcriptional regulator n=1 Tax=unclassified Ochrobactrum TaxID=239106 RepID=UPI000993A95A|nr:DNA-binding IclR family transcriptional regulator [Ochrobactrum sp. P6BSIII]OOL13622.1 hypothetical protein BRY73_24525 [Ochrobactrum sp. P6BS-III]
MSIQDSHLYVKSVEKAFLVLGAFNRDKQSLTLAEIAAYAGLDRSAVQRFVFTLHGLGYLTKETSRNYRLSPRLLEFGFTYLDTDPLIALSQDHLKKLHDATGETINLAQLVGADVLLVSRLASEKIVSVNVRAGAKLPALYTASGLTMVAHLPGEEQERIIDATEMQQHTEHSIVEPGEFRRLLQKARDDNYCVTRSLHFRGDLSVAAPIFNGSGEAVASVSITSLEFEGPDEEREALFVKAVSETAGAISKALGALG